MDVVKLNIHELVTIVDGKLFAYQPPLLIHKMRRQINASVLQISPGGDFNLLFEVEIHFCNFFFFSFLHVAQLELVLFANDYCSFKLTIVWVTSWIFSCAFRSCCCCDSVCRKWCQSTTEEKTRGDSAAAYPQFWWKKIRGSLYKINFPTHSEGCLDTWVSTHGWISSRNIFLIHHISELFKMEILTPLFLIYTSAQLKHKNHAKCKLYKNAISWYMHGFVHYKSKQNHTSFFLGKAQIEKLINTTANTKDTKLLRSPEWNEE